MCVHVDHLLFYIGILILSLAMLPMLAIWLNAETVLVLLQQPPCVARYAVNFYLLRKSAIL